MSTVQHITLVTNTNCNCCHLIFKNSLNDKIGQFLNKYTSYLANSVKAKLCTSNKPLPRVNTSVLKHSANIRYMRPDVLRVGTVNQASSDKGDTQWFLYRFFRDWSITAYLVTRNFLRQFTNLHKSQVFCNHLLQVYPNLSTLT